MAKGEIKVGSKVRSTSPYLTGRCGIVVNILFSDANLFRFGVRLENFKYTSADPREQYHPFKNDEIELVNRCQEKKIKCLK